jgi:hypothetical protein
MNISMLLCSIWGATLSSVGFAMTWQSLNGDEDEAVPSVRSILLVGGVGMVLALLFCKFI